MYSFIFKDVKYIYHLYIYIYDSGFHVQIIIIIIYYRINCPNSVIFYTQIFDKIHIWIFFKLLGNVL